MSLAVQRYLKRRFGRAPVELEPYVVWPQGSWVHLEMGKLDLGIMRDSTLNSTNDFQIFGEMFEGRSYITSEPITIKWGDGPYGDKS